MSLIETLMISIGAEIGKSLLKIWLKERPLLEAAGSGLIDTLKSKTPDLLAARKAQRQFETLGDKIAKSLEPAFKDSGLKENSYNAVAYEATRAIAEANISSQLLADLNYNYVELLKHIKNIHPNGDRDFSEAETRLYNRVLSLAAQYIIDVAPNLPKYTSENFTQILQRLDDLMQNVERILEDLEKIRLTSEATNQSRKYIDFERDYRALIVRKFDRATLFGADVSRRLKRYQLSVAYVSLDVASTDLYQDDIQRIDVQEALSDSRRTAIIGEAGTGKTTLLYWLAVNSASNMFKGGLARRNTIPFIIELRRYKGKLPSPKEFLDKVASEIVDEMPKGWVQEVLRHGEALLLIDGLDEVPIHQRENVYEWLENILGSFDFVRVVFTSRPSSYEPGELNYLDFKECELIPMQYPQIKCFVEYWHEAVLGEEEVIAKNEIKKASNELLHKIQNKFPLRRLATNPLLCAMLCALHFERQMQLPADRSELYEACCSMLLERRDSEREIDCEHHPKLSYKQKRVLLDDLAYWMMKNRHVEVEKSLVISRFQKRLNNMFIDSEVLSDSIVSMLVERSGIIREPTPDSIDFIHRTFQEYMAASAASSEDDWGFLLGQASDDQWQETIILASGFSNKIKADKFVQDLLNKGKNDSSDKYKFDLLAFSCLETVVEISSEVRHEVEQRVNSLIPPKRRDELKPLAAAGELVVPYLVFCPTYSVQEATACLEVLRMIGTQSALLQASTYLKDKRLPVIQEIYEFLSLVTPEHVIESGLVEELLEFISESAQGDSVSIHGSVLNALSTISVERIKSVLPDAIAKLCLDFDDLHLDSDNDLDTDLPLVAQLPSLQELVISGNVISFQDLSSLKNLRSLDIRNFSFQEWPSFNPLYSLETLMVIRLSSEYSWPFLSELKYLPSIQSLSLLNVGEAEIENSLLYQISEVSSLEHIHFGLAGSQSGLPDLNPLGKGLYRLKILEISSIYQIENLFGLDELPNLEKIILNVQSKDMVPEETASQISFFCSNCIQEINEGWNPEKW